MFTVTPSFSSFAAFYGEHQPQLLTHALSADVLTPVAAFLRVAAGCPHGFLFESVEGGAWRGRYSFLGIKPDVRWECRGGQGNAVPLAVSGRCAAAAANAKGSSPLESLRALHQASLFPLPPDVPPMAAGLFGSLGYDMVRLMEHLPDSRPDPLDLEEAVMVRPTLLAVFDHVRDTLLLATPVYPVDGISAAEAYHEAKGRLETLRLALERPGGEAFLPPVSPAPSMPAQVDSNFTKETFCDAVRTAKEYITAGDIFQVVPSQRFSLPFTGDAFTFYRRLRQINPAPFLFYMNFGGYQLVGSSPEILVRLRDGTVTIRPIAGTRPRGKTPAEDAALAAELLADPKEQAEHLMLLDLGRNDVGRMAEAGTVEVTQRSVIERYSHVMHIVSNVTGRLRAGRDALDALIAGFPAGTVSGAPKVRAMEIIDTLESCPRRFYGGAVGYLSVGGDMDTCIALRTALIKDGTLYVQAGAGVVADSVPELEYEETRNKAMALLKAAGF